MSIFKQKASSGGGGDWELPPEGNHSAVCVAVIDLGTHAESYQGVTKEQRKVYLAWELVGHTTKEGKPHVVCDQFTVSFNEKAKLRKLIETWRGKKFAEGEEFEVDKIVGRACFLQISHGKSGSGNDIYKIDAVTTIPKGIPSPTGVLKPILWGLESDEPIPSQEWLPFLFGKKVSDKINDCIEKRGRSAAKTTTAAPPPQQQKPKPSQQPIPATISSDADDFGDRF